MRHNCELISVRALKPGLLIFSAALAIRLLMLGLTWHAPLGEGLILLDAASNISEGRGLILSDSLLAVPRDAPPILARTLAHWKSVGGIWGVVQPGRPTAFLPPLYPLLLSMLSFLPGPLILTARLLGALLGAITSLLVYSTLNNIGGGRRAILGGLLLAVSPLAAYQSVEISTHCSAALTLMLPLYVLTRRGLTFKTGLLSGTLAGIAFLIRPTAWLLVPLLIIWVLGSKKQRKPAVGLLLGLTIIVGIWVGRNAVVVGKPLLFTTNGGRNLWEFNNQKLAPEYEWSEPRISRWMYDPIRTEHLSGIRQYESLPFPTFTNEPEWERDRILTNHFKDFVLANPIVYAKLVGVRIGQILAISPLHYPGAVQIAFSAYYLPFLVLAATGMWMALFTGGLPRVIALYVFAFFALHALTAAGFVYRGMISPLLAMLASYALCPPCKNNE